MCQEKLLTPLIFEGSCNYLLFEKWLAEKLLLESKKGQLVVLENASFDKSPKIR